MTVKPDRIVGIARLLAIVFAAGVIPAFTFMLVYRHAVDFPFYDELDLTPLMVTAHGGKIPWDAAWFPHNGHRIFVPTLLVIGLAQLGGWSQLREVLLSVALLTMQLAIIWRLIVATLPGGIAPYALLVAALLTFSFAQWENLLIGFQLSWILLNLCAILAIYQLNRRRLSFSGFTVAFAATTVSSLSAIFGLCMFPVGLFVLASRKPPVRLYVVLWSVLTVFVAGVYLHGYTSSPLVSGLSNPTLLDRLQYVLVYYGSPLGNWQGIKLSETLGAVAIFVVTAATVRLSYSRLKRELVDVYLPWMALCLFSIFCGILTAYERVGLGIFQATASRYTLIGANLWIGVFALTALMAYDAYQSRWISMRWMTVGVGSALFALAILLEHADRSGYRAGCTFTDGVERGVLAIQGDPEPTDAQLDLLYNNAAAVRIYLAKLAAIGDPRLEPFDGGGAP